MTAVVLIYSSSAAIGALRHAVETANEKGLSGPAFPKNKGLDILILLVTLPAALIFISLALSRGLAAVVDDSAFLAWVADNLGGPIGIFAAGVIFYTWIFWVLNPGKTPWKSALLGAAVAVFLSWVILTLIRLWFDFSGGGSAVYGVIASFLGVLICLNFFSMAIVFGAHMAATVRLKPWREVLRSARTAKTPDGEVN